ncbi:sigma factor binding protein 1, chloroplastic-like [Diospyros lotus]|uniref:sigma factor binding protein 1, chloroplastic-like n=1 Tax=Diospyros lotus TaxID=55363 RepID=UPI00225A1B95|nr:sigma factor binding protein 1, chloroplastic-like [Diospyros lotus]
MDKAPLSFTDKKPSKTKKTPNPLKVVYISNPIRIRTTASHFKALVQELTGQDAAAVPDPAKSAAAHDMVIPAGVKVVTDDDPDHEYEDLEVPIMDPDAAADAPEKSDLCFQPYDDVFMPPLMDNFPEFLPANLLYEPPHADDVRIWNKWS